MAKYYAIVKDTFVQQDINTGQLEVFETKKQAKMKCPKTYRVIAVKVKKCEKYIDRPFNDVKPTWFESDDYEPFDDPTYERTYFDT